MKKRLIYIFLCVMLTAVFCGCKGEMTVNQENEVKEDENEETEGEEDATVYTNQDIYIYSFECGYLSQHQNLRQLAMIESAEQLSDVKKDYAVCSGEVDEKFHNFMADEFEKLESQYPIEEYTYLLCYDEVSSGGYYLHADRVQIKDGRIGFLMDDESYSPGLYDITAAVMGGFFHLATIPKEYLDGMTFENVVFPEEVAH